MLALLGFLTVAVMLALIITKKATPTVVMIAVPFVSGIISCFLNAVNTGGASESTSFIDNFKALGGFITGSSGIGSVASTGVMFIFSILFFGVLTDAGTFRPIIKWVIKIVGKNPVKVTVGTAVLAMIVHLDGSGAVTFLVCIPALLPLYDALGMKRTTLATVVALAAGSNVLPWSGAVIRAATALGMGNDVVGFFQPVLPAAIAGLLAALIISAFLGHLEGARIKGNHIAETQEIELPLSEEAAALLRPHFFWVNIIIIISAITCLLFSGFPPAVVFMVFYVIATSINYPNISESKKRVDAHAKSAILMASVLFAAGCFTGIMKETGMIGAMAEALTNLIPSSLGRFFPVIIGIISMPASLLFDPDSFYYGVLPVLSVTSQSFGVDALSVGRAAILGQMTTGFPISPLTPATFLLVGLAGVDFGEHQKKTFFWLYLVTIIMLITAVLTGAVKI